MPAKGSRVKTENYREYTCDVCQQTKMGYKSRVRCDECRHVGERLQRYGIDIAFITDALIAQDFKCAACGITDVSLGSDKDHDHNCCPGGSMCPKCFRGVVCKPCNIAIGGRFDNPEVHIRRAAYLLSNMSNTTTKEKL